jgi:acetylornithine deacetylase/succinyl-diaminopimelate desuccinylase family protein
MEPVVKLLADLVAIPSMNPMGRARTGKEYTEASAAEFIAALLRGHSIDVQLQQVAPGRPNVMGYINAAAAKTALLEAHLDTVSADTMVIEPFHPLVRDGKLYGRGSCDTKGSCAAFLQAACNALENTGSLRYNVLLLFVSDEEYRFGGAEFAARNGLKADFGIVGEPTSLKIVRAHKGVTRWRIVTKGIAAHSAFPQGGRNAIYAMARIVQRLEEYANQVCLQAAHPLLGGPTLNVGVIEGGSAVNVVPDRCWIEVERRSLPGETTETILAPIRSLLKDLPDWGFEEPYLSVGGMEVTEGAPVVQTLARSIIEVTGGVTVEAAHYSTDAGYYNNIGIPTVVFGPGNIAQAHTDCECIELHQLQQAVKVIERFLTT